jgi:hypothetical protein
MLKSMKTLSIIALAVAGTVSAATAKADPVEYVQLTFASGAHFSGDVTFAPGYTSVEGVTGTLTGYQYGTNGFIGSGSETIDWAWYPGANYASGNDIFGAFLVDGPPGDYTYGAPGYTNWIAFTYDYSGAPSLVFSGAGYGNEIDYNDPLVSGSITATPEPNTLLLLASGLVGLAFTMRRKIGLGG